MSNSTKARSMSRLLVLALCAGTALTVAPIAAPAAEAQSRGPVHRTCEGVVVGSNDAPLSGAVVYLKDTKTLAVKTFLSDDEGVFHFGLLSTNTDYDIHAEFDGKRSKNKSISSFDSKNDFHFTLKVDALKK